MLVDKNNILEEYKKQLNKNSSLLLYKFIGNEYYIDYEYGDLKDKPYEKYSISADLDNARIEVDSNYKCNMYVEPADIDSFYNPITKKWVDIDNFTLKIKEEIVRFNTLSQLKEKHTSYNNSLLESLYVTKITFLDREMPYLNNMTTCTL
jgi:hypothetical protein